MPLESYIAEVEAELEKQLARAVETFDAEAIHKARVATRRLTGVIEVCKAGLSRKPRKATLKALKKLRHWLGDRRDVDVQLGHLAQLGCDDRHVQAAYALTLYLEQRRDTLRAGKRPKLSGLKFWKALRDELAAQDEAAASWVAEATHDGWDDVVRRAGNVTQPHTLRIAAKELRYALELASELKEDALLKSAISDFKQLQDALGLWHDFSVLTQSALQMILDQELLLGSEHEPEMMMALARETWSRAGGHLANFSQLWSDKQRVIDEALRHALPLVSGSGLNDSLKPGTMQETQALVDNEVAVELPSERPPTEVLP